MTTFLVCDKFKDNLKRFYAIQVPAVSDTNGKPGPVKRESGENPERSRHCVRERIRSITGKVREERRSDDRSQETCLSRG